MKKITNLGIKTLCATTSLVVPLALTTGCSCGSKNTEVHIVSINDFHGAAPGFGDDFFNTNQLNAGAIRLAQETQEIISQYPGSTFISCGDYNAGESFSTSAHGETLYPVLKAMNIQYSAVGNHAWEWGNENLINKHWDNVARTDDTVGNYFITSNVLNGSQYRTKTSWNVDESSSEFEQDYTIWNNQRVRWADPYKILNLNGHNVCLIGLTTTDTLTDGNINAIKELSFMSDYNASVVYTKHLAKEELKDDFNKIESFILLTHCSAQPIGDDINTIDPDGECAQLAKNSTTDFDAIFAAHSHRLCVGTIKNDITGKDIVIGQAGQSGRYYLDTKIIFDDSKQVGKRLSSISMEIKTPKIDCQDLNPVVKDRKPDQEKAAAQLKNIVETTKFDVVKNTAKVYEEQKLIAKEALNVPVGTIKNKGLPYYYTDNTERSFGTQYMQSPTLVEPATVFTQKGLIDQFNQEYKTQIEEGSMFPAAIAFGNIDSYKNGFNLAQGQTERQVTKNEVFSQNAFENNTHYGCLTEHQLIQYINYILEGAGDGRFSYEPKVKYVPYDPEYNGQIWLDPQKEHPMEFSESEKDVVESKTSTTKVYGTSYSCGPVQFYGLSFTVKHVEDRYETSPEGKKTSFHFYQLDETYDIKIYDAADYTNDLSNPKTWSTLDTFLKSHNNYIPIIISQFTWQGGNAQNRMLNHWFEYNKKQEGTPELKEKIAHKSLSLLTRDAVINYALKLTSQGKALDEGIDETLIKKMIQGLLID